MTIAPPGYNFAKAYGIDSVAGAVIFAALYLPFLRIFISEATHQPTQVYIFMAIFCVVRIAAFVLRAFLAAVESDGQNPIFVIAFQTIYDVGFFALLHSVYTLVLETDQLIYINVAKYDPILIFTRHTLLFRIVLTVAVAIGGAGSVAIGIGSTENTINTGNALRQIAIYILLALSFLVAYHTIILIYDTPFEGDASKVDASKVPSRIESHRIHILCIISLLLLARETFFTATANELSKQNNEKWWYPLSALTEFVAVMTFALPGLVPPREKLPEGP